MPKPKPLPYVFSATIVLGLVTVWASELGDALREIARQASANYQASPGYSSHSDNYYPYAPPPSQASEAQRRQHAYDVGYRVGQDDFHHHHSKHFVRHPDLYDDVTHDAFANGYGAGYDHARDEANRRDRSYQRPQVHAQAVPSDQYASGYYPYAPPSKVASSQSQQRHAYEVGFRVGQDDFYKGVSKHFTRHDKLFTKETHDAFAYGYDQGYDQARSHAKR